MVLFLLARLFSLLLTLLTSWCRSTAAKDLEILALRHQLAVLQRRQGRLVRLTWWEKLPLALIITTLKGVAHGTAFPWRPAVVLVTPETVLRWHRELVRRKWTHPPTRATGRPSVDDTTTALILRLAKENPRWGYGKIHGELCKLGITVGRSTVRDVLKRHRVPPAPQRQCRGATWRQFLAQQRSQMLACDFFTVEAARLQTLYVLFFIELATRRMHVAACTAHPTAAWVTQQARNLCWTLQDQGGPFRFLIHDRDSNFGPAFDTVFEAEGFEVVRTPYRAPRANAVAERWVRSVRDECLDRLLIVGARHLERVLRTYLAYYNERRPHQGLDQQCPAGFPSSDAHAPIVRRDVLGGMIHDYERQAA